MVNIKISRFSRAKKLEPINNEPIINESIKPEIILESKPEIILESKPIINEQLNEPLSYDNIEDDNFLDDLNNTNYKPDEPIIKESKIKEVKTKDKPFDLSKIINQHKTKTPSNFNLDSNNLLERIKNKSTKKNEIDDSMFSQNGSEILGRDKRILLTKIRQYKSLFPDIFKTFKIKLNATSQELQNYIDEMDSIVECDSCEQFLLDSILQCIKLIEGVSSYTRYDIQGLADLLKQNKQFHQLCKQLFIKYKIFTALPIESQMVIMVTTSAYICNSKNKRRNEMSEYLNTPANINQ
jgi:hypothetical protein